MIVWLKIKENQMGKTIRYNEERWENEREFKRDKQDRKRREREERDRDYETWSDKISQQ